MRNKALGISLCCSIGLWFFADSTWGEPGDGFIVTCATGVRTRDITEGLGIQAGYHYAHAINGFAADLTEANRLQLQGDTRVSRIEADGRLHTCAQQVPFGISRTGATRFAIARGTGADQRVPVDVAVLDTGIDLNHPDLNVYRAVGFAGAGLNGDDWNGHGSHVSGIIGALDNNIGVLGVAPGVRLWSVQVLGPDIATFSSFLAGIDYVLEHADEIEVVNASLGAQGSTGTERSYLRAAIQAVVARGIVFVVAAGNDAIDIYGQDATYGTTDDFLPAAIPEVMAVSAVQELPDSLHSDIFASFSNFSRSVTLQNPIVSPGAAIDLAAPGVEILSTYRSQSYDIMSGTSMAAPHVAGLAALYVSVNGRGNNAADVARIRQDLVNGGLPQTAWATTSPLDPDPNHEPLGFASPTWLPTVQIQNPAIKPAGPVQFSFTAATNRVYTVEAADALRSGATQWQSLAVFTNRAGEVRFTDSSANTSNRFYRVGYRGRGL